MQLIETGFDEVKRHWWYRIKGTELADRGYLTEKDAHECAAYRYWDDRPVKMGEVSGKLWMELEKSRRAGICGHQ
jgi:hypothetical protein